MVVFYYEVWYYDELSAPKRACELGGLGGRGRAPVKPPSPLPLHYSEFQTPQALIPTTNLRSPQFHINIDFLLLLFAPVVSFVLSIDISSSALQFYTVHLHLQFLHIYTSTHLHIPQYFQSSISNPFLD